MYKNVRLLDFSNGVFKNPNIEFNDLRYSLLVIPVMKSTVHVETVYDSQILFLSLILMHDIIQRNTS